MISAKTLYCRWQSFDSELKYAQALLDEGEKELADLKDKLGRLEADAVAENDIQRPLVQELWVVLGRAMVGEKVDVDELLKTFDGSVARAKTIHAQRAKLEQEIEDLEAANAYNAEIAADILKDARAASEIAFAAWRKEIGK